MRCAYISMLGHMQVFLSTYVQYRFLITYSPPSGETSIVLFFFL